MRSYRLEHDAPFLSRVFFAWVKPLLATGARGRLTQGDMFPVNAEERSETCADQLAAAMRTSKDQARPVLGALRAVHGRAFAVTVAFGIAHALLSLSAPYFLRELLIWMRTPDASMQRGLLLAGAIFVAGASSWLTIAHGFYLAEKLAIRIRAGLVAAVYRKALHLSRASAGRVLNVLSGDIETVYYAPGELANLVMGVVILAMATAMLWMMLGVASLAGIAVLIALIPISNLGARLMQHTAARAGAATDARVGLLGDVLRGIRVVKLSAWETALARKIEQLRRVETSAIRRFALQSAALSAMFLSAPVIVALAVFAVHVALDGSLDMATAFSVVAVFGLLRPVLLHLPSVVSNVVHARTSLRRIDELLAEPEVAPPAPSTRAPGSVSLQAARIGWDDTTVLCDVALEISPGELVVVLGPIGAGKSTLLGALLGNAGVLDGTREVSGRVALAPQEPFLIGGTVKDNILFGADHEPARYRAALAAACLDDDLAAMPAGDATEIGERGSNLSGGQRHRVSLARAFYADADVVFLDDPLSGLDAVVSAAVIERGLFGALAGRTRILVTHRHDLARRADKVVLVSDGRLVCGPPAVVLGERAAAAVATVAPTIAIAPDGPAATAAEPLVATEERAVGAVPWSVYRVYLRALLPAVVAVLLVTFFLGREVLAVGTDFWLSWWSSDAHVSSQTFIIGFAMLAAGTVVVTCLRGILGATRGVAAAAVLHRAQLDGVLRSPLSFFETSPLGRIVNRFSKDQRVIDQQLSPVFLEWLGTAFLLLSTVLVIVAASPPAMIAIALIGLRYYQIQKYFRASVREVRRLDAVARSPLVSHFAESLGGVTSIRAYRVEHRFEEAAREKLEASQRTMFTQEAVRSWISVRLDLLGSSLAGIAALVAVLGRSAVDPRLAALSITYAMVVTYTLGRAVRATLDVESNMSAVERVKADAELPAERWAGAVTPAPSWPAGGALELDAVTLRYRPGLPLALREVSLSVAAGEKIAIVGRTGAGKSSIVAALFRLVELESGRIRIDGVDLAAVPLATLRERLTIIPQDPFLFQGTVRDNLDPEGRSDDAALWDVLRRAHADAMIAALPRGLDAELHGGASILSAGQKQLLCLARALLRPSRLLVIDEATASVDAATDALVVATIAREFATSTVVMIAHRLEAVHACDRVVVMDDGRIIELGAPRALLADADGAFARLAGATSPLGDDREHPGPESRPAALHPV